MIFVQIIWFSLVFLCSFNLDYLLMFLPFFNLLILSLLVGVWGYYVGCVSIGSDSLFSILLFCRIMDMAYCMAMTLSSSNVCLMFISGILNMNSIFFIEGVCVVALAPAVMTISGSTFHPLLIILSISGLYYLFFMITISSGILSLPYVNSMNCIVRFSFGFVGGGDWYGSPFTHNMPGLNLAL